MQMLGRTMKTLWGLIRCDIVYSDDKRGGTMINVLFLGLLGFGLTITGMSVYLHIQLYKLFLGVNASIGGGDD